MKKDYYYVILCLGEDSISEDSIKVILILDQIDSVRSVLRTGHTVDIIELIRSLITD